MAQDTQKKAVFWGNLMPKWHKAYAKMAQPKCLRVNFCHLWQTMSVPTSWEISQLVAKVENKAQTLAAVRTCVHDKQALSPTSGGASQQIAMGYPP